ncbi:MAG: carbohydrate porin [Candidatus Omnitrophota bacterium]|jgi:carbohydrate-selective porin OprB
MALIACFIFSASPIFASEAELMAELSVLKAKLAEVDALKARVVELEKKIESQSCAITSQGSTVAQIKESLISYTPGEGLKVPPCGIEITADATFVIQGTPKANAPGESEASRCDAAWSSDIFIRKAFDDWGLALIHLEPGQGQGAEGELSLYSNVNRDQNDTSSNVPVTELWYEHYLFNKQIAVTAGKMDPANYIDQNEYAHDECTQFLGRMFKQNPAVEWPNDNALGMRLILAPEVMSYLSLEMTYFNADNSWEEVFSRPFVSAQLNVKPSKIFNIDKEQWDGNYRFYWWFNDLNHFKLAAAGETADNHINANTGFGLSFDQMVTDVFGVFVRFGWQKPELQLASTNPNAAQCEASWSGGMQVIGKPWNRPDDVAAFGIGQIFPSKQYKDAGVENTGGEPEGHLELYYKLQILKWLAITPDVQWIWNPHGVGNSDAVFVYGMRGQLDF